MAAQINPSSLFLPVPVNEPGTLWIHTGRTGQGKTTLMANLVYRYLMMGHDCTTIHNDMDELAFLNMLASIHQSYNPGSAFLYPARLVQLGPIRFSPGSLKMNGSASVFIDDMNSSSRPLVNDDLLSLQKLALEKNIPVFMNFYLRNRWPEAYAQIPLREASFATEGEIQNGHLLLRCVKDRHATHGGSAWPLKIETPRIHF